MNAKTPRTPRGKRQGEDSVVVREADASELIDLRHAVLRKGFARETARFPGDFDATTRHFAAVDGSGGVVGCVTLVLNSYEDKPAWQLRGMAVDEGWQGRGVGKRLMEPVEAFVRECAQTQLLWCNARIRAVGFYERLGWEKVSRRFNIARAGVHYRMVKRLI